MHLLIQVKAMKVLRNILIRLAKVTSLALAAALTAILSPIVFTVFLTAYVLTGKDLMEWYINLLIKTDDKFDEMMQ